MGINIAKTMHEKNKIYTVKSQHSLSTPQMQCSQTICVIFYFQMSCLNLRYWSIIKIKEVKQL